MVLAVLYAAFFSWYTSFGGPLSDEEIDRYVTLVAEREDPPPPERLERLRRFLEEDTGDDFVMVNVIDMYDEPLPIEGVEPGETSEQVMDKYMAYMIPALVSRASHPVLYGSAANSAMDIMNATEWRNGARERGCGIAADAT